MRCATRRSYNITQAFPRMHGTVLSFWDCAAIAVVYRRRYLCWSFGGTPCADLWVSAVSGSGSCFLVVRKAPRRSMNQSLVGYTIIGVNFFSPHPCHTCTRINSRHPQEHKNDHQRISHGTNLIQHCRHDFPRCRKAFPHRRFCPVCYRRSPQYYRARQMCVFHGLDSAHVVQLGEVLRHG